MPAQRLRAMSCGANCAPSVAKNPTNSTQHDAVWAGTAPRAYAPPCHTHCCGPRQILCIWIAQNTQRAKADAAAHFKRPHKKSVNKRQKTARKTTQAVGMHGECSKSWRLAVLPAPSTARRLVAISYRCHDRYRATHGYRATASAFLKKFAICAFHCLCAAARSKPGSSCVQMAFSNAANAGVHGWINA